MQYHAVAVSDLNQMKGELEKRAAKGWKLAQAYPNPDTGALKKHVLIFERG